MNNYQKNITIKAYMDKQQSFNLIKNALIEAQKAGVFLLGDAANIVSALNILEGELFEHIETTETNEEVKET